MSNDLQEVQIADTREVGTLARKMGEAYREMMGYYVRHGERTYGEARDKLHQVPEGEELARLENEPAAELSWWELSELAAVDPDKMLARWEEVKQAALQEVQSGHRAASAALMPVQDSPMDRARFLAIRHDLALEWKPRGGIEQTLLDQMAQAWTMQLHWQELAATRSLMQHKKLTEDDPRWQLRDMRRYSPQVTIHSTIYSPAQVNIGEKQINVAAVGN